MKFSTNPPDLSHLPTFEQTRAAFLREVQRYSRPMDMPTVWMILRTVYDAAPEAFQAFADMPNTTEQNLRKQFARNNKARLDAEDYARFLYDLYRWKTLREVEDPQEVFQAMLQKPRALRLHGHWKDLRYNRAAWLNAQSLRRKRMGRGPFSRTEIDRLERLFDKDTRAGRAFKKLVTRILTGRALPMTPFAFEELTELVSQVDSDEHSGVTILVSDYD